MFDASRSGSFGGRSSDIREPLGLDNLVIQRMPIRFDCRGLVELADCVCLYSRYESDEGGLILILWFSQFSYEKFA